MITFICFYDLAGTDPDYATRDLFEAIKKGSYPIWTVYIQVRFFDAPNSQLNIDGTSSKLYGV